MGFFKNMIRKYDPIVNLSRVIGVPIMKKKRAKGKSEHERTQEKRDEDTEAQRLTIKRGRS